MHNIYDGGLLMNFFRNPEIKREILLYTLLSVVVIIAVSFSYDKKIAFAAAVVCLLYTIIHFISSYIRYTRINKMSSLIDDILHEGYHVQLEDYKEGDLSLLANEIHKVLLRLTETEDKLVNDKVRLMDSIADISHQLRTPLTSINLIVAMLNSEEPGSNKYRELVAELKRLIKRIEWLIESLLKMSRFDAGAVILKKDNIAVSELIKRACEPLAIPLELSGIELITDVRKEAYVGDMKWSVEAVGNIIKNCMEHTGPGGYISVKADETPLFTSVTIRDTGCGFEIEDIPNLFERFYKGSNASEDSFGIGLALARMIIVSQNGTIKATNYHDDNISGAQFEIRFYKGVV